MTPSAVPSSPFAGRLLVVADRLRLVPLLQDFYPEVKVLSAPSFMTAIAELGTGPVHAVLAFIDPGFGAIEPAVRGLRHAAGERTPVVLCCEPVAEPLARRALGAGASDYVIYPPEPIDLDRTLALRSRIRSAPAGSAADVRELESLGEVLEIVTRQPTRAPEALARLLMTVLPATSATVELQGASGSAGPAPASSVIRHEIVSGGQVLGSITLGAPRGDAYAPADLAKLRHYAAIFGHLVRSVQREHHWEQMAMTDDLTGLPNRRYLMQFLESVLQRAAREQFRVTVCMFDIDDFKKYNDEFGHAAGDQILQATARLLQRHCRAQDVVARHGGDEFVVVFWDAESPRTSGSQHPHEAMDVMQRFQESLAGYDLQVLGREAKGKLTISGGLASYPWDATTAEHLLARADAALLSAKEQGKSRIHLVG